MRNRKKTLLQTIIEYLEQRRLEKIILDDANTKWKIERLDDK